MTTNAKRIIHDFVAFFSICLWPILAGLGPAIIIAFLFCVMFIWWNLWFERSGTCRIRVWGIGGLYGNGTQIREEWPQIKCQKNAKTKYAYFNCVWSFLSFLVGNLFK